MTRIFDALKKAQPTRPTAVPPLSQVTSPAAATGAPYFGASAARPIPAEAPGGFAARSVESRSGYPLVDTVELNEDIERQMISLRMHLESALGERTPRVVSFHSSQSGEGTSSIVQQFCRVMARDPDLRILVFDAHVERPTIQLDESRQSAFYARRGPAEGARESGVPVGANLHALPVPEEFRTERIYPADAARETLDALARSYDWIVMDGPPVLEAPDAAGLAALADGAVMVVRAGRTKRPVLARAVDLLRKGGARVVGSVLNGRQHEIPEFIYRRI